MFLLCIAKATSRELTGGARDPRTGKQRASSPTETVVVVTYRNVPSLPPTRCDDFPSIEEAIKFVKAVEPKCPRVSLDGSPPDPTPSWEDHLEWLHGMRFFPQ